MSTGAPDDYYDQLVGGTIKSFEAHDDGEYTWPRFTLTFPANHQLAGHTVTIEVSRDAEGNGPGFLFIDDGQGADDDDDDG